MSAPLRVTRRGWCALAGLGAAVVPAAWLWLFPMYVSAAVWLHSHL